MLSTLATRTALAGPLFGMPTTYQIDSSPLRVVSGDIDAKNGPDLVTGNDAGEDGPSLSILLNRGQGTFQAEVRKNLDAARDLLQAVTVGDFNGDGAADIAVATDDLSVFPTQTVVQVFRNNGSGQLSSPDRYPLNGFFPQCLEAADVNNDGILDLVVCHTSSDSGLGLVSVLLGRANGGVPSGSFDSGLDFTVGTTPATIVVGDVDHDSRSDLVVADTDRRQVFLLYGTGTSALLTAPVTLVGVDAPSALRIRESPGDAFPEILVASIASNQILILHQTAPRAFATAVPFAASQTSSDMGVADFDGDGITDLALLSPVGGKLSIWYGTAEGGFTFGETVSVDDAANSLAVADLNGDGKPDVATTSFVTDRVTVALNVSSARTPTPSGGVTSTPTPTRTPATATSPTRTPTRTPTPTFGTPLPTPTPAGPGDVNCDGKLDEHDLATIIVLIFDGPSACLDGEATAADLPFVLRQLYPSAQ